MSVVPDNNKLSSIRQADTLRLGHAIHCAKHHINNESFVVFFPDVLVLEKKN